jgi:hypothetical protein
LRGRVAPMTSADDEDAGVAGVVGVPPACGGEWRQ